VFTSPFHRNGGYAIVTCVLFSAGTCLPSLPNNEHLLWLRYSGFQASCHIIYPEKQIYSFQKYPNFESHAEFKASEKARWSVITVCIDKENGFQYCNSYTTSQHHPDTWHFDNLLYFKLCNVLTSIYSFNATQRTRRKTNNVYFKPLYAIIQASHLALRFTPLSLFPIISVFRVVVETFLFLFFSLHGVTFFRSRGTMTHKLLIINQERCWANTPEWLPIENKSEARV
jgi:hypothetical protein